MCFYSGHARQGYSHIRTVGADISNCQEEFCQTASLWDVNVYVSVCVWEVPVCVCV